MTEPTSTAHGGDRIAAALHAHGVRTIFTLCGGHISPILVAAKARGIRIVDTRDEATAVFAADAIARLTGVPGVAAVTAGPGLTNTITALKNAQLAQSPVLLIGGAAPTALQGRGALQDIDQRPLIAPHVKLMKQVRRVKDLGPAVTEALAVAREPACPARSSSNARSICSTTKRASGSGTRMPPARARRSRTGCCASISTATPQDSSPARASRSSRVCATCRFPAPRTTRSPARPRRWAKPSDR